MYIFFIFPRCETKERGGELKAVSHQTSKINSEYETLFSNDYTLFEVIFCFCFTFRNNAHLTGLLWNEI